MVKETLRLVLPAVVIVAGTGCAARIVLYNNSQSVIMVSRDSEAEAVSPRTSASFRYRSVSRDLTICRDGVLAQYIVYYPTDDPEAYTGGGLGRILNGGDIRVQMDEDGRIRIARHAEPFPISPKAFQPQFYPLGPENRGACALPASQ
jgi:hypothetical protein